MIFQGVLLAGLLQAQGKYTKTLIVFTCLLGIAISVCQAFTAAGAKFWQARWEQKVKDTEIRLLSVLGAPKYELFSGKIEAAKKDVERSMRDDSPFDKPVNFLISKKFSVGKMPIYVGLALSAFWFALLVNTFSVDFDFKANNLILPPENTAVDSRSREGN
ncbi:hypothetical protein EGI20_16515 [Aquitalea sp. S1-19]|nr:hypothetical protein [Aquitalea sp. S1-19]